MQAKFALHSKSLSLQRQIHMTPIIALPMDSRHLTLALSTGAIYSFQLNWFKMKYYAGLLKPDSEKASKADTRGKESHNNDLFFGVVTVLVLLTEEIRPASHAFLASNTPREPHTQTWECIYWLPVFSPSVSLPESQVLVEPCLPCMEMKILCLWLTYLFLQMTNNTTSQVPVWCIF